MISPTPKSDNLLTPFHLLGVLACALIMGVIVALAPFSEPGMFLADQGISWYYWKLAEPDFWSRFSAWSLYALHQAGLWGLILWAQYQRPRYGNRLHLINWIAISYNLVFVGLHILQTRYFYDGLAQDVSVWSSQFSVIFMLVFILIMENRRRGLFFGKRLDFVEPCGGFLRRYHGYYFSWAIIYTFWFHPIEATLGHLLGTFYILMLLLQGSLFFTHYHRNRVWTLLLEVFVLFHGAMVAWLSIQGDHWPMFLFGFATLFIITQMHGVGLSRATRVIVVAVYAAAVGFTYREQPADAVQVLRIPAAELGLALGIAALFWLAVRIRDRSASKAAADSG